MSKSNEELFKKFSNIANPDGSSTIMLDKDNIDSTEETETAETSPEEEEAKKKKPEEEEGRPGFDEDEEEEDLAISSLTPKTAKAKHKSSVTKNIKVVQSKVEKGNSELVSTLNDRLRQLQDEVNSPEKYETMVFDNGDVPAAVNAVLKVVDSTLNIVEKITLASSTKYQTQEILVKNINILTDLAAQVAEVYAAKSQADRFIAILDLRQLLANLYSANPMMHGEANIINGLCGLEGDFTDLWQYFQIFTDSEPILDDDGNPIDEDDLPESFRMVKFRDKTGDNAIQPDVTIIKNVFLLWPSDTLKNDLLSLGISEDYVGVKGTSVAAKKDYGILGFFTTPTQFSESATESVPEEELTVNHYSNVSETADLVDCFDWSHNGSYAQSQKTLKSYQSNNDAFVKEIKDMIEKARECSVSEFNPDVCFFLVLTQWLNGALKAMIDINASLVSGEVLRGMNFDTSRMFTPTNDVAIFSFLDGIEVPTELGGDASLIKSLWRVVPEFAKSVIARTPGQKFAYSTTAYSLVCQAMKTMTYGVESSTIYYIGEAEIGKNVVKATIIPKLILPVDMSADNVHNIPIEVVRPRSMLNQQIMITNGYNFGLVFDRSMYVARRNVNEVGTFVNMSLWHLIAGMEQDTYELWLENFYTNNFLVDSNGHQIPLGRLFDHDPDSSANIGHYRKLSGLAPAYNRAKLLGQCGINLDESSGHEEGVSFYPTFDQLMNRPTDENTDTEWVNETYPYYLGDAIKALFNFHGDFSWIEAGIVICQLYEKYITAIEAIPTTPSDDVFYFGELSFYLDRPENGHVVQFATYSRRMNTWLNGSKMKELFPNFMELFTPVTASEKGSSHITKADLLNFYKYAGYAQHSYYVVDNLSNGEYKLSRKAFPTVVEGDLSEIKVLVPEGESVTLIADQIKEAILDPNALEGAPLIYDNVNVSKLSYTTEEMGKTDFLGIRVSRLGTNGSINATNNGIRDVIYPGSADSVADFDLNRARYAIKLGINQRCYLVNDVYPHYGIYTVNIPDANKHFVNEELTGITQEDRPCFNNIKSAAILLNLLFQTSLFKFNSQGTNKLVQGLCGVRTTVDGYKLIDQDHEYVNDIGFEDAQAVTGANDDEAASFGSSYRYPTMVIMPAFGAYTGHPEAIAATTYNAAAPFISRKKTEEFYKSFGSIIPNRTTAIPLYVKSDYKQVLTFTVRASARGELGSEDTIGNISIRLKDVLAAIDMLADRNSEK